MRTSMTHHRLHIGVFVVLTLMLGACISTSSEPDIVATRILSPEPETNGGSGVTVFTDSDDGTTLYQENCATCHGEDGTGNEAFAASISCELPDFTERPDDVTLDNLVNLITNGTRQPPDPNCPMPPWGNSLDEVKIQNVAEYVYSFADGGEAAVDNSPQVTEEPRNDESTSDEVDNQPDQTEEPSSTDTGDTPTTIETFTLNGTLVNGTEGADIPESLTIVVRLVDLDSNNQPVETFTTETESSSDGSFSLADIPIGGFLSIETEYVGIRQFNILPTSTVTDETVDFEFIIYELTDDPSNIEIVGTEYLIDAITAEQASLTFQNILVENKGDRIYMGSDEYSVEIPLPVQATGPAIEALGALEDRFIRVEEDGRIIFRDTSPIFPGREQYNLSYGHPYNATMTITQSFPYLIHEHNVYVAQSTGLLVDSETLSPSTPITLQETGTSYNGYISSESLDAGEVITFRVYDDPNIPRTTSTTSDTTATSTDENSFVQENANFILGLGVLLIIAGSIYLVYDLQKTRILAQSQGGGMVKNHALNKDDLIAEIAELDEAFEKGELEEEAYQQQRAKLKEILIKSRLDE